MDSMFRKLLQLGKVVLLLFSLRKDLSITFPRTEFLENHTKIGREPSKAIVLLVLYILEALKHGNSHLLYINISVLSNWLLKESASEKSIKDFIAASCSQWGLKATNRGSIAGMYDLAYCF